CCSHPRRCRDRAAASPAFSGPRSRATTVGLATLPRQDAGAPTPSPTPRMGPAPAGATTTLRPAPCTPSQGDGDGSGVGGLGVRAQDPFALAAQAGSLGGFDEAMLAPPRCLRASVGRRTHARTARPRADVKGIDAMRAD